MAGEVFRHRLRVIYAHCTLGNHVYYARYLDFLEEARGEFFRAIGQPLQRLQEEGAIFPVLECRLTYKGPARYDDVLTIELVVSQLSKIRLGFHARVLSERGTLLVEGTTEHVCTGLDDKPRRLPPALAAALEPFVAR